MVSARHYDKKIRIGYVPMTDCATLIASEALNLFQKYDLQVELVREPGWATVREKMLNSELDGAHAPASMVFEMTCGLGVVPSVAVTGFVMALNGNAITLSNELWDMGVRDASTLKKVIHQNKDKRKFTFAGVLNYSSQHYQMRKWLRSANIDPDNDVRIAIVPPPLVFSNLEKGFLDGYCVAEPWNSIGITQGQGWCATLSCQLDPGHVEKIFMVRADFDEKHRSEHLRLICVLMDAAKYCDNPENREFLVEILSSSQYLSVSKKALRSALVGPFDMGKGRTANAENAITFHKNKACVPNEKKSRWVLDEIIGNHLENGKRKEMEQAIRRVFREDIFYEAKALHKKMNER